MTLHYVTLTGKLPGAVGATYKLFPSNWVSSPANGLTFPPKRIVGKLTDDFAGNGILSKSLLATDNADINEQNFQWTLEIEGVEGTDTYTISFLLPAGGVDGVTTDITALEPVSPVTAVTNNLLGSRNLSDVANPALALANLGGIANAATIPLPVNNSYSTIFSHTVTGQTDDPLPPFGAVYGSRTYGASPPIQGPALWMGYNPALYSKQAASASHGAAGINFFADAGDTNISGAHGLEVNIGFVSPDGNHATGAFQMVAVDDNNNTVNTTIRCGTGVSGGTNSNIIFQNGDASTTFCIMSNAASSATFSIPTFSVTTAAANANFLLQTTAATSVAIMTLSGNNGSLTSSQLLFSKQGTASAWALSYVAPNFVITDVLNGSRTALGFVAGSTSTGYVYTNSMHKVFGSLIIGSAALANNATAGFLYLPSMPGAPTGVPATQTGTIAAVYDTTNNQLCVYNGAWKKITLS